ncbi:hypothetical protein CaCOL14_007642 [Colletotrichum acutatum]
MGVVWISKHPMLCWWLDLPLPDGKSESITRLSRLPRLSSLQGQRGRLVGHPPALLQFQTCEVARSLCCRVLLPRLLLSIQLDLNVRQPRPLPRSRLVKLHLDIHGPALAVLGAPLLRFLAVDDIKVCFAKVDEPPLAALGSHRLRLRAEGVSAQAVDVALLDEIVVVGGLEEADAGLEVGDVARRGVGGGEGSAAALGGVLGELGQALEDLELEVLALLDDAGVLEGDFAGVLFSGVEDGVGGAAAGGGGSGCCLFEDALQWPGIGSHGGCCCVREMVCGRGSSSWCAARRLMSTVGACSSAMEGERAFEK